MGRKIFATGAAGLIGSRLMALLAADDTIESVVAMDVRPPAFAHAKIRFLQHDVSKPFPDLDEQPDEAVHLAFALNPMKNAARQREINLGGTENFLSFCAKSGVSAVCLTSSGTAYGAHADNPEELRESDPLRAQPDFPYAYEKVLMEGLIEKWREANPNVAVSVFRPCILMCPEIDNYISRILKRRFPPMLAGCSPPTQFVHTEDVARAIALALKKKAGGAFNIGAPDIMPYSEVVAMTKKRPLPIPASLARPLIAVGWKIGLFEAPAGLAPFMIHSWVMNCDRLKNELEFEFQYTAVEALESFLEAQVGKRQ